jgi:hypothetical protein
MMPCAEKERKKPGRVRYCVPSAWRSPSMRGSAPYGLRGEALDLVRGGDDVDRAGPVIQPLDEGPEDPPADPATREDSIRRLRRLRR